LAPITSFPGGNPRTLWYVALGLWIVLGTIIWWIFSGIIARMEGRELLTSQEIEERESAHRDKVQSRLEALEVGVGDTKRTLAERGPRSLTPSQKNAITKVAAKFPAQEAFVHAMMNDPEAARYAQDFVSAFRDAGWKSQAVHMWVGLDFYNTEVAINQSAPEEAMQAAVALKKTLIELGLSADDGSPQPATKVPQGNIEGEKAINLRVGPKPVISPPLQRQLDENPD
jgi:hypothetical protein